jgi:hypothetical protein
MNFISTLKQITYFKIFAKLAELNKAILSFNFQAQVKLREELMPKPLLSLGFKYFNCILNLGNTGQIVAFKFSLLIIIIIFAIIRRYFKAKLIRKRMF